MHKSSKRQSRGRASMPPGKSQRQKHKTRHWTLPSVLSLVLGILGIVGLIELRPQMLVAKGESLWKDQPFAAPFRLQNSGYLAIRITHVFCYWHEIQILGNDFSGGVIHANEWDNKLLARGEGETVPCNYMRTTTPPKKADVAVVVDATMHGIPVTRRYFRFVGACAQNCAWTEQPSEEIQDNATKKLRVSCSETRNDPNPSPRLNSRVPPRTLSSAKRSVLA